ncbi:efflux RND transporter periplasmic adaptor subunit [Flavobacteriaceae bacterium AH-315-B10]|nr:efflux RND transporter periplasmic adaptor subunit [Flavobacteriaceae bacterium AH-315-B10]
MKNIKTIITILFIGLIITSCGNTSKNKEENHDDHSEESHSEENEEGDHNDHDDDHEEGTVSLTELQMEAISLQLTTIENKNMNIMVKASGSLEVAPHDKADVSSIIGGIIKNIYVIEGDEVKKGKILARVEHPDIVQMQQDYINNLNSLQFLEKEYERRKILYEEKVGSGKEFQRITAEYRNSKTNLNAQKMKLKMLGLNVSAIESGNLSSSINIVSPLNGKVSLVETNIGAYAAPLSKLFEIVNSDELHADVMVFEKDISKVKIGQTIKFTTSGISGQEFSGKIHAISPVFEEFPKAIHVHAEIKNKNKILIPGMYIQGHIIADNLLTTVLPEKSIVVEDEKSYIFAKTQNEEHSHENETDNHEHEEAKMTFKMIEVITGINNNNFIEIKLLEKLPKNTLIVGNGAYFLLSEMRKSEAEHSH